MSTITATDFPSALNQWLAERELTAELIPVSDWKGEKPDDAVVWILSYEGHSLYMPINYYLDDIEYCGRIVNELENFLESQGYWYQPVNSCYAEIFPEDAYD